MRGKRGVKPQMAQISLIGEGVFLAGVFIGPGVGNTRVKGPRKTLSPFSSNP
jgi:hypothetical protein